MWAFHDNFPQPPTPCNVLFAEATIPRNVFNFIFTINKKEMRNWYFIFFR